MSNAKDALQSAYAEWRRLAEAEGAAIRAGNWLFLAECQQALSLLRGTIDRLTAPPQNATRSENLTRKQTSRATILELIELQRQNLASLQRRRERLSAQIEHLSRAGRNLRGIQRSYSAAVPAAWSSYS